MGPGSLCSFYAALYARRFLQNAWTCWTTARCWTKDSVLHHLTSSRARHAHSGADFVKVSGPPKFVIFCD